MSDEGARGENVARTLDGALRIGLIALLAVYCFLIVRPFIGPILWGVIIAIGCYPGYRRLETRMGGRSGPAAAVFTLLMLVALVVPAIALSDTLVESAKQLAQKLADGTLTVPPPPPRVAALPFIGKELAEVWGAAAENLGEVLAEFEPQVKAFGVWVLGATAKAGLSLLVFVFAIIIAGILMARAAGCRAAARKVAHRLFGERGTALLELGHATVMSVARGILGIALLQTVLAGLGFVAIGLPGAGLWALICLVLAVVQIDILLVLIPISIYAFSTESTVVAVAFLVWNIAVGLINNVLKPILLGRGVDAPMAIVFMGAIGGLLLSGIIGLFVGAVVLVLGFKLFQAWLEPEPEPGAGPAGPP